MKIQNINEQKYEIQQNNEIGGGGGTEEKKELIK